MTNAGLLDLAAFHKVSPCYGWWIALQLDQVQAGCDGTRGDDISTLKSEVIWWIATNIKCIDPSLSPCDKEGCGLNHILTGCFLYPVDYNWTDPGSVGHRQGCSNTNGLIDSVHTFIQKYHPDFHVTAYSWLLFLYKGNVYNPNEPPKGLFQSDVLMKVSN